MKVLVTGSLGQLGREVIKQLAAQVEQAAQAARAAQTAQAAQAAPTVRSDSGQSGGMHAPAGAEDHLPPDEIQVVGVDLGDLDIADLNATLAFCRDLKPDAILNCAAFTAVDVCESDPDAAYKANAIGPRNLAMAAAEIGAKLVHVSTDYVFDGTGVFNAQQRLRAYHEFDATNPQTVYGRSKLAGELYVQQFCHRWFILRTAWLYGDGNNFVKTMLKLASERDEVRVVADQHGTPTSARVLANCMLELLQTDAFGLYHATCEGETTWHGFTEEIFRQRGLGTKVTAVTTEEFPRPAPRPRYSVLDNSMLRLGGFTPFPDWKVELAQYLSTLG